LSNSKFHRRRWSFEKGRHSSSVIFALLITAMVTAVVLCSFRYNYRTGGDQRQTTDVSLITDHDYRMKNLLERFDPAHIYGINNGGQPFCLTCRRSHHPDECTAVVERKFEVSLDSVFIPELPEYRHEMPELPDGMKTLPPAVSVPQILPHPAVPAEKSCRTRVIAGDGRIVTGMEKLEAIKVSSAVMPGVIRISGEGLLLRSTVIKSCGNRDLDKQAENILKAAGLPGGLYIIDWAAAEKENK